ncbi:hypothetical protein NM688_g5203 [Phlebia brevispora]|uniref:Uncharacterized protein n=1 Tax=Phlebia brevispora TaxID=194682 RepID=A0ACC1SZ42_9APHY|nr:hypothetical protein NM688_g5203 [Phlebia brevispora]
MDIGYNLQTERDRDSVHVYIREDIRQAKHVTFNTFIEAVFHLPPARLAQWTSIIRHDKWLADNVIQTNLNLFCKTSLEHSRYDPLCNIINRIIQMAPDRLPGVPAVYPIDDMCVKRNALPIRPMDFPYGLAAIRRPALLTIRGKHIPNLPSPSYESKKRPSDTSEVDPTPDLQPRIGRKPRNARAIGCARTKTGRKATRVSTNATTSGDSGSISQARDAVPSNTTDDPPGVRWVDAIMNWELKASTDLVRPLALLLKDRKIAPSDTPDTPNPLENPARPHRPRAAKRGGPSGEDPAGPVARPIARHAHLAQADDPGPIAVLAGTKRRREDDDDDLLYHIRKPDPPTVVRDNLEGSEKLSKDVKDGFSASIRYSRTTGFTSGITMPAAMSIPRAFLFLDDFEKAAAVVVGLACCTPEQLGAIPSAIKPPPHAPYPKYWPPESLKDHSITIPQSLKVAGKVVTRDVQVTLQDHVFAHYVLAGRRTFVYTVKTKPAMSTDSLIIKFSYQVSTRRKEHELIEMARRKGIGHLPDVYAWGDVWKMSDGVRQVFYDKEKTDFEDRTLRTIVYKKYLPLDTLFPDSPQSIPLMAYQLMDCLHDLYYTANMLHRDVSFNNVMYEYRNDRLYFILIDFDMATEVSHDPSKPYTPSSKHRTGTLAFMAVELIEDAAMVNGVGYAPIAHRLCHDLESIFWLCLWCMLVLLAVETAQQREKLLPKVRAWETKDLWAIAHAKSFLRFSPLSRGDIELPKPAIEAGLEEWFLTWTDLWVEHEAVMAPHRSATRRAKIAGRPPPPFDYDTAGGTVTRDKLKDALIAVIPEDADVPRLQVGPTAPAVDATPSARKDTSKDGPIVCAAIETSADEDQEPDGEIAVKTLDVTKQSSAAGVDGRSVRKRASTRLAAARAVFSVGKVGTRRATPATRSKTRSPTREQSAEIVRKANAAAKCTAKKASRTDKRTTKKASTAKKVATEKKAAPEKKAIKKPTTLRDVREGENDVRKRLRPRKR